MCSELRQLILEVAGISRSVQTASKSSVPTLSCSAIVTDQLKQAIGKGWQSIELTKYEQFNDVIEAGTESVEEEAKRLENMRIHAKTSGATSSWMTSKHSKQYEEILKVMNQ